MDKMDERDTRKVCIVPHMGLSDMLILNGLVRTACAERPEVLMFVKRSYISSLRTMFGDLPNLRLKFVDTVEQLYANGFRLAAEAVDAGYALLLLGVHSSSADWKSLDTTWQRALYRQAGLDPGLMRSGFRVQRNEERERALLATVKAAVGDAYVVVHDDPGRSLVLDRGFLPPGVPVVHVDDPRWRTKNIFDYASLIDNAIQFHALDSCFLLMADLMRLGSRAFCHAYVRTPDLPDDFYKSDVTVLRQKRAE